MTEPDATPEMKSGRLLEYRISVTTSCAKIYVPITYQRQKKKFQAQRNFSKNKKKPLLKINCVMNVLPARVCWLPTGWTRRNWVCNYCRREHTANWNDATDDHRWRSARLTDIRIPIVVNGSICPVYALTVSWK